LIFKFQCFARAFPNVEDKPSAEIPEADKLLIQNLASHGSAFMVVSMVAPQKVMEDVVQSILDTKKADQHMLDYLQYRMDTAKGTASVDDKYEDLNPDYMEDLWNMFDIYAEPKYLEKRIQFNFWTNGQFDKLIAGYNKTVDDLLKLFFEAAKTTVRNLSETTKNSHKDSIEKLNNAVDEQDIFNAAMRLFGELSYSSKLFRSIPNSNVLKAIRTTNRRLF